MNNAKTGRLFNISDREDQTVDEEHEKPSRKRSRPSVAKAPLSSIRKPRRQAAAATGIKFAASNNTTAVKPKRRAQNVALTSDHFRSVPWTLGCASIIAALHLHD